MGHVKNKVEVVSYYQAFRQNFQFVNLKESSSKLQCASYNQVYLINKKIREVKIHLSFGQNTKQIKGTLSLSNYAHQTITKAMIANMRGA